MDNDLITTFRSMTIKSLDAAEANLRAARQSIIEAHQALKLTSKELAPDGVKYCRGCGSVTTSDFLWSCPNCEDPNGGDGMDD